MNNDESDFYPLDPQVQNKLIQLRLWDKERCVLELKEILPNFFNKLELDEIFEIIENQNERELKEALIKIFQNVSPAKLFNPSNFN